MCVHSFPVLCTCLPGACRVLGSEDSGDGPSQPGSRRLSLAGRTEGDELGLRVQMG